MATKELYKQVIKIMFIFGTYVHISNLQFIFQILSSYLAHMFFVTMQIIALPGCYGNTHTRDQRSLSYFIFIVLGEQESILMGHEAFV